MMSNNVTLCPGVYSQSGGDLDQDVLTAGTLLICGVFSMVNARGSRPRHAIIYYRYIHLSH